MTTRRPLLTQRTRPSSQVYIGHDPHYLSSPPDLPDLPEPPSPGSSSSTSASGLPSPPATNSTGSGSTGDPGSIAVRGGQNMLNGTNIKTFHAAFHSSVSDHHDEDDLDNDIDDEGEDNTARLNRRHSASENVLALQRVKSLTERNKMALDKLSTFSRLRSPSPSTRPTSTTRSPQPLASSSSSSSQSHSQSTSSHSSSSNSHSSTRPSIRRSRTSTLDQSGSETERDDMPMHSPARPTTPLLPRQRLVSAPASPQKHITAAAAASSSSGSSTRSPRRSRISALAFTNLDDDGGPSSPEDITRAALAAVDAARRSDSPAGGMGTARFTGARVSPQSTGPGKRRQPLPREWAAGSSSSGSHGRFSTEPPTSPPSQFQQTSPNKRHSLAGSTASSSFSPRHAHSNSTSSTSTIGSTVQGRERSSTVRDLARRHQTRWMSEDLSASNGVADGDREPERRQSLRGGSAESALGSVGRSLLGEGLRAAGLAGVGLVMTPARVEWADGTRIQSRLGGGHARATTSMADYASARRVEDAEEIPQTPALRAYRSSAVLDSHARAGSAMGRYRGVSVEREEERERAAPSPSPFGSVRRHGQGASGQQEHTKLMGDSLAMFEGHLGRIGSSGSGAATDLARSAQTLVVAAERLNGILRAGTARALEEQIDAEVNGADSGAELVEVWRRVGGEYREGLRVSDELVRGVTGLLLGVGRVMREFGEGRGSDEGRGSASPEGGRRSDSRRSLDGTLAGRESALGVRPSSVLNTRHEVTSPRNPTPAPTRRLLTPREQRELQSGLVPSDSQETVQPGNYEPSPTPASRKQNQGTLDRSRTLPPISIPKPLPSLPSENTSTLRRNQTATGATGNSSQRRRTLTSSTVRGTGLLPSTTTPTTALTPHTVSNSSHDRSDARMAFPTLARTDSDKSAATRPRNNTVTFSRPSTVALAGLQMQHERERQRTISGDEAAPGRPSGSETEKDNNRKRSIAVRGDRERARMSLDGGESTGGGHAADRSAAAGLGINHPTTLGQKRERRRTVTDIWPPNGS
ncbi:hypothetical protein FB45DRAFT_895601 [Roridomyces roridus]|uniref:Uncharacterized protein n=1 Tax=Roridomyces roridus TaxID=1738132 RepID=A0AAD7FXX6_9AGAR|nr:hypothetical protein FB45DRAFT_895601 [Roridomyces roridus]